MEGFKDGLARLYASADAASSIDEFAPVLYAFLKAHESDLRGITASYRLLVAGGGSFAFALCDGALAQVEKDAPVDVTVSGRDENLLAIFRRKISPEAALLMGRVRVKGSMPALLRLAKLL